MTEILCEVDVFGYVDGEEFAVLQGRDVKLLGTDFLSLTYSICRTVLIGLVIIYMALRI